MRKPLIALGLAFTASLGGPVADGLAATLPTGNNSTPPVNTYVSPVGNTTTASTSSDTASSVSGAEIVQTAMRYIGYPYTATGNSPSTGFSCIGFVSFVYRSNGIELPGDLGDALAYAPQVPFSQLEPGDILYFQNTVWAGLSHAAIYIGGGRFIHAEWYNRGVTISSFSNDPHDGNYWIGKYLGANRPWTGPAVSPIVGTTASNPAGSALATSPTTSVAKTVSGGPTALVSVPSLNVRAQPNMAAQVRTVVQQGTQVVVLGKRKGWYRVQLPNGSVGWVIGQGIGQGTQLAPQPTVSVTTGGSSATIIGNPTAPTRQGQPTTTGVKTHGTVSSRVTGLNVRSSPSTTSQVVTTVSRGQKLKVIARQNGWVEVRLPDGSIGWVMATYTAKKHKAKGTATTVSATAPAATTVLVSKPALTGGKHVTTATNVRGKPSLSATVVTVLPPGGTYRVIGWSGSWAHVRLADGTTGWISSLALGTAPTYGQYTSNRTSRAARMKSASFASSATHVLTAGVRVHARPSVSSMVVTVAAAGTRVRVLGHSNGFTLVQLADGQRGYVLGTYVR